ncbi:MAG: DUF58 domain-containing protein [Pirellulaceae bacterium]|nr:DUF58 domain-containing protein [Pirellulaceae bacterium]HJN11909.1 DUF58 domain-containing protein [Pirellulaceae bacterium]
MSSQSVAEILKKVQRIQIVANRTVNDLFAGQYKSVFRGRGMEFDEVRHYQPGDDIRSIDWNVTARTGDCFIKRFCEERELTVLFVVDVSASGVFGSTHRSKLNVAVEIAALLMFSALKNNDKVGLITFCDEVIEFIPPRKGKAHTLRLIRQMVDVDPVARPTRMEVALEYLNRVQKRRAVVFVISDFLGQTRQRALAAANRRHDLTAITVEDRRELELPDVGFIRLRDAETGETIEVDTRHRRVREMFRDDGVRRREALSKALQRIGVDQLPIDTEHDYLISLRRFFHMRQQRFR